MHTPGTAHAYNAGGHRGSALSDADSRVYMPSITSEEILDEHSQKHGAYPRSSATRGAANRKVLLVGLLVLVAIVGAVVAYVVTQGDSDSASTSSGDASTNANDSDSTSSTAREDSSTTTTKKPTPTSSSDSSGNGKVLSDPNTGTYPLTAFAIGDWGATLAANDSCCQRRKGEFNAFDWHAEVAVNKLMDMEARNKKPMAVISHGDNFYWTGIDGEGDQVYRFEKSFESRHRMESMMDVPWINVMGNHDYGGGSFICMENSGRRECTDPADLVASLQKRFELQSKYVSPNNNRWIMKDHFYIYSMEKDGVSIDVFNLDMNDAESHGAHEICCQCYDYSKGNAKKCKNIDISSEYCLNRNVAMYNACMGQFRTWGEEARTQLLEELQNSKADWKIVNSHYNPYGHYGATNGQAWLDALKDSGLHVWIAGHTHGEKHDYIADVGVHFIENGAGGGIQSESASGVPGWLTLPVERVWTGGGLGGDGGNTYGFFAIDASTEWLKVRYMTFGDDWSLVAGTETMTDSMVGGVATGHCWYVPSDGSKGQEC